MNTYTRTYVAAAAAILAILGSATSTSAQALGAAQSFAVVGGQSVTVAGAGSTINGDVGVSPGTSITGIPAGATVVPPYGTHANDGAAVNAQAAVTALYTDLAGRGGATAIPAELGGTVRNPGIYSTAATANIAAGTTLTLDGAGIYIFKIGSALTANVLSNVLLINGATACNIFWQVTSAATLNGATFSGNVVAQAAVTLGTGAALAGRALTTSAGSVTLAGGNTIGGCSGAAVPPAPVPPPAPPVPPPGCPAITLSPAVLPNGTVGVAFSQTILASGGTAPYTFAVSGGALPTGLTLTPAGVLAGTPTTAGTFAFTIRATDANGCTGTIAYTVTIAPLPPPPPVCPTISFVPATLPNATVGVAYSQTLSGVGGNPPYHFGVQSGTLPTGLTLTTSSPGVLAGTPTAAGTFTFTIRVTDSNGCVATQPFSITVAAAPIPPPTCPPISILPATLANGVVGVFNTVTFSGSGGTGPYVFGVTSGALPTGVTLTPAGVLSGRPNAVGTTTFTIRGTDANGCFEERTFTVTIIAAVPTLPQVFVGLLGFGLTGLGYLRLRRRSRRI